MASFQPQSNGTNQTFQAIHLGASQKVAFAGTSTPSTNGVAAGVTIVRLYADADCYVAIGDTPVATAASMFLPLGVVEYFGIAPGQKVAAIQSTAPGTLYITEGKV